MASKYEQFIQDLPGQANEFKVDNLPDNKSFLKDIEIPDQNPKKNKYEDFLQDDIMNTKVFPKDPETEFGIGQAFLLGLGDSVRGISQFVGREKGFFMDETLEEQQRRLNTAMQAPGGGLVAAAYFGGAILDPVTWLIPVLKGKKLWQMAKFGAVAGGLGGALGYVDENSLFDTRSKQALGGALGGAIITPAIGKGLQLLKVKKLKKSFGISEDESPDISKLNENDFIQVKLPGSEDVTVVREGQKRAVKKVKGRGDVILNARKNIKFKKVETSNDIPKTVNQNQQNDKSFLLRGPREFFKTLLGPYKAVKNSYEKNIGKPAFDYFTEGKFGPELGSGLVGGAYGFSLPEEDSNTTTRLSRAVLGFMAGAAGMKGLRTAKIPGTAVGKQDDLSIATYLGRAFIDGFKLPKEIAKLKAIDLGGLRGKIELQALRIAQKANQLTPDEKKILYNMLEGDIQYPVGIKALDNLSKEARENINGVTQMYIDAGLITEETALRNIKRYLRRSYAGDPPAKLGSDLKARGIIEEISPKEWLERYSKEKAFIIDDAGKTVPLEGHNGWELFGRVKGKKLEGEDNIATEDLIKKLAADPKKANEKSVTIRWEYTKQERLGMGEIEDGAFAILETGRLMSQTLPQYKFYADVAQLPFVKTSPSNEEIDRLGLVQIPTTKREGTIQPVYGKLAGKFVPPEVKENIVNIYKASSPKQGFFKQYRTLNQIWKSSKTAWNPTVHVNNIVSNFVLTDLVDGNIILLPKAATAFSDAAKGKRSKVLELAQTHGVFDVDYVTKELGDIDPKKINSKIYQVDPEKNAFENATGIAKNMYTDVILKDKLGLQKLSDWYRSEDAVFRLALFMDRLNKGYSAADAALDARKSFIDYNISAPGINALRNLPTPFLAYTYRVIPILAETAVVRPWKFAKYAVLGYMLNNLGSLLGEGDEEAERAAATQNRQGKIFGLPFLPHRSIKLPTQDKSRYIDVTRYVPGGDVLDLGEGKTIPLLPAPLQPSFGLAGDLLFPLIGYDIFKAEKVRGQGVSAFDDFLIRGKAVVEKNIPNFPFVPGAYSTRKIEEARVGDSPLKATDSELLAFANSIGIKIREIDLTRERRIKTFEFAKRVRGIREQLTTQANKYRNGSISIEEYRKKEKELTDKYNKIEERYVKALNLPVKQKDLPKIGGITSPFSEGEALGTIGEAIMKQTEKLIPSKEKKEINKYEQFLQ